MPVKSVKSKITPGDFFLSILVFGTLYASAVAFLALIFAYVNLTFPDKLGYYGNYAGEIITPSSILLVIFPVFILTSWLWSKDLASHPEKREIKFRKWLIYLTLFAAAITIMVDLITLIASFYHGELTSRFVYKVLAVLLVAAGAFSYYFLDLKRSVRLKPTLSAWVASMVVLAALIGGFFLVGSPAQQRARRFDERRVNDLQTIQMQLVNYWMQKEELPESLQVLENKQLSGFVLPKDPETGVDYIYKKLTVFSFEICANFKTDSKTGPYGYKSKLAYPPTRPVFFPEDSLMQNWSHGLGETCFERTIDPELYKKKI